jgi:hypothetical protein
MKVISANDVETRSLQRLGLDPAILDISSPEALATLVRRIASFTCPCSPSTLVSVAVELIEPLRQLDNLRETLAGVVDTLTAGGDLVESLDITGESANRVIYLTPPSFVEISDTLFLLLGGGPDGTFPLPSDLVTLVEPTTHCRRLRVHDRNRTVDALLHAGFLPVEPNTWLKAPPVSSCQEHLAYYDSLLDQVGPAGTLEEIVLLDSQRSVTYYVGRWAKPKKHSGRYLARRPQAYGADLWCFALFEQGRVVRLVDLPVRETRWRSCDEAWHLQQALDAVSGTPQRYRRRSAAAKNAIVLDFFSPLPLWASRRWDYVGTPTLAGSGSLLSYLFLDYQLEQELTFARERMWLQEL